MPTLTSDQAKAMARRRQRHGRPRPRSQILKMQASLLASATDASVPAHVRAAAARAWDVLEERLRIIDGKPLPGQLRPELDQLRKLRRPGKSIAFIAGVADGPAGPAEPTSSAGS